jgi:hypothetical protein
MIRYFVVCLTGLIVFFCVGCSGDVFVGLDFDGGNDSDIGHDAVAPDGDPLNPDAGGGDGSVLTGDADVDGADGFDGYTAPTFRRVFISSETYTANLGGASGADAKCNAIAGAAGLGGTWAAWVSTSSSTAKSRFVHSTVPWKLLDGTVIANDWSDLVSGSLEHNIDRDEKNNLVTWNGSTFAGISWTSTYTDGTSMLTNGSISDCSGFTDGTSSGNTPYAGTGYIGYSGAYQGFFWTCAQGAAGYSCDSNLSLLCFEQ